MSPIFFNVFTDDLSPKLTNANVGSHINCVCISHICYGDDSVLMAPSPSELQTLISKCNEYDKENDITYNSKKSIYI